MFLAMDKEFLEYRKLSIFMKYYIKESIDLLEEDLSAMVSSSTKKALYNTNEIFTGTENKYAEILHSILAKLLWLK